MPAISNQSDDTPLTNEMLDLLCDEPDGDRFLTQRGFQLPPRRGVEVTWLSISVDFSFGVENDDSMITLGINLDTLGKLRELCHVLGIKLDETRLVPGMRDRTIIISQKE